jgi:CHASE3 domain sensor protein
MLKFMNKKRILIYFGVCIALFSLLAICFYYVSKLNAAEKYADRVDRSYDALFKLRDLENELLSAETSQRGFAITKDPAFLEQYQHSLSKIPDIFLKIDYLTFDNYQQQKCIDTLKTIINTRLAILRQDLELINQNEKGKAGFTEGRFYMDKVRGLIIRIGMNEQALLKQQNNYKLKNSDESKTTGFTSLIIALIICCLTCIGIISFFNRSQNYLSELKTKNFQLKTLNEELEALIYAGTHNLQEPMRKMQILVNLLEHHKQDNPDTDDTINRIKKVYNDQSEINNAIVDYYTLLTVKPVLQKLELNHVINAVAEADNWKDHINVNLPEKIFVHGDETQVRTVFKNLLENAVNFKHPDRTLKIEITEVKDSRRLCKGIPQLKNIRYTVIAVKDNGVGIERVYHGKVFDLFQQLSENKSKSKGMGLSICKRIMLNHDSWILIDPGQTEGTRMLLFFPKVK